MGHLLYHYIGDAIAPDTKTDASLDSGIKEATSARVDPNTKHYDTLDDWKGEGREKKEQKGGEEEENGEKADHDEGIRQEGSSWSGTVVKVAIETVLYAFVRGYGTKMVGSNATLWHVGSRSL